MTYWVHIYGPRMRRNAFSRDNLDALTVLSLSDVKEDDRGNIIITTAPRPAMPEQGDPATPSWRPPRSERGPETVFYPRGEVVKIRIGEVRERD